MQWSIIVYLNLCICSQSLLKPNKKVNNSVPLIKSIHVRSRFSDTLLPSLTAEYLNKKGLSSVIMCDATDFWINEGFRCQNSEKRKRTAYEKFSCKYLRCRLGIFS